jgi:hypothetical protein
MRAKESRPLKLRRAEGRLVGELGSKLLGVLNRERNMGYIASYLISLLAGAGIYLTIQNFGFYFIRWVPLPGGQSMWAGINIIM